MMTGREAKQVIVIRRDLGMRRGKEIAQGAHASMAWLSVRLREAFQRDYGNAIDALFTEAEWSWLHGLFTKVVCQVPDEAALNAVYQEGLITGVLTHRIIDAGKTEFGGIPTFTAVAVGPDWADAVDAVTGRLALY
jgi:PTH2 family peptidyl-tRNA hydrolase